MKQSERRRRRRRKKVKPSSLKIEDMEDFIITPSSSREREDCETSGS